MIVSLIVAMTTNRIIGIKNSLPWNIPMDMIWFKKHTINKPIIVGRKTFESIGNPLPKRHNIVLSTLRHPKKRKSDTAVVSWVMTPSEALSVTNNAPEVMVIGGAKIYEIFLPKANKLYLTHVETNINGDTRFPDYKYDEWRSVFYKLCKNAIKNKNNNTYNCCFEILERRN
ncbi:type 3 dihydrofolate reductase [Sodalis sp. CWE]|uniref:type 3 dihydrofolate reductase n=1 Tax=Sodalis sp. CWE TaxID=2803816 RepID=UPI001C7CEA46|nr:type 3 dihydrofolate reductase [Sodalis sp. CWE]MBX4180726.1 type 3 dihydrofolate reductase [Sodalis sp. CWE]